MEQIGRYVVSRVLGAGAFATVWLGYDPALEAEVAIKVLADNWSTNGDVRERFLAEARLLRRIDDPSVVRVFDIGVVGESADGQPYFVMDYLPGGTLADRLGTLSTDEALGFGVAAADAVQILHDADVVHRDVKPSNLLIDSRSDPVRLVIADLGSAKSLAESSGVTVTTGTPAYMAPEQAHQTNGFDGRADVYAVAAVTYHLLSGRPAFEDKTALSVLHRDTAAQPPPLPAGLASTALEHLLRRSLSWDPDQRPATAADFGRELARFIGAERLPATAGPVRRIPTTLVIVVCLVLGAGAFWLTYLVLR